MNHAPIHDAGAAAGSLKSYLTGFILALILTAFSFSLVMMGQELDRWIVLSGIYGAAMLQILVHLHYFLHLDRSSTTSWNGLALILTVLIMTLFVAGTLWIMLDLNTRMM